MTRYLNTSVVPPKYWEARAVDDLALEIDEGAVGTLGKRTNLRFGDPTQRAKELAKRTKAKRAKGFVALPDEPPTVDALLAAYAPHDVEAAHGDRARAVAKALAAMPPTGGAFPREVARSSIALASRGFTDEARALRDALAARAADATGDDGASQRAAVAAVHLALGERESARAQVDAALATSDAWRAGRRWHLGYAHEGVLAAEALLDLGRDNDARDLYDALGYHGLASLLARGRLAWFDAIVPSVKLTGFMADLLGLRRARAEGDDAFCAAVVALTGTSFTGAHAGAPRDRLLALAVATRECEALSAARASTIAEALHGAIARWSDLPPPLLDASEPWVAVAAIATLGGDIAPYLARAATSTQRAQAVATVARATRDPHARAAVAALARGVVETAAEVNASIAASAFAGAVDLGVPVPREALTAAAARVDFYALGTLAATALRQGDRATAWHLFGLAPKRYLGTTVSIARHVLAAAGDLAAYKVLSDAIPPVGEADRREECTDLATRSVTVSDARSS